MHSFFGYKKICVKDILDKTTDLRKIVLSEEGSKV